MKGFAFIVSPKIFSTSFFLHKKSTQISSPFSDFYFILFFLIQFIQAQIIWALIDVKVLKKG